MKLRAFHPDGTTYGTAGRPRDDHSLEAVGWRWLYPPETGEELNKCQADLMLTAYLRRSYPAGLPVEIVR